MRKPTRTQLLIEERLDEPLADVVDRMREDGRSWMAIAHDLGKRTDVVVTPETLRLWFGKHQPEPAAS